MLFGLPRWHNGLHCGPFISSSRVRILVETIFRIGTGLGVLGSASKFGCYGTHRTGNILVETRSLVWWYGKLLLYYPANEPVIGTTLYYQPIIETTVNYQPNIETTLHNQPNQGNQSCGEQ